MNQAPPTEPHSTNPFGTMPVNGAGSGQREGPIGEGVACVNCGYSLLGLDTSGVCPECGTPCEYALRGNLLVFAGDSYFRSLRLGIGLVLNSILLQVILVVVGIGVGIAMRATATAGSFELAVSVAALLVNAMFLYGWWRFSEPDPGYLGQRTGTDARQVVRIATIAMAGLASGSFALQCMANLNLLGGLGGSLRMVNGGLSIVSLVASAVQFFAAMLYVRWLAPRLPNRIVYTRAKRNMWLLPLLNTLGLILLGLGPLIALVMYWNHLDLIRKDLKRIAGERGGVGAG